ncbi:MAG: hypothetical protein FWG17_05010 [Desulfovibrionaceae bacterium]|nr:hypothetical protein [Desulfovibrionaceae bacterium]
MRLPVFSRMFTLLCVFLFCAGVGLAQAASPEEAAQEGAAMKAEVDAQVQALLNSPAGVFDIEYEDGQLMRLKIKGESEVATSLQGARGDRQAREKAERSAKASFSQFLNEQVTVVSSDTEGFLIQEKDGKESAEYLNASQRTMASLSNSFQRGLITLFDHVEGEGANRKAVVVLGWSKKLVDASAGAQSTMNQSRANESNAAAGQQAAPAAGGAGTQPNTQTQTRTGNLNKF